MSANTSKPGTYQEKVRGLSDELKNMLPADKLDVFNQDALRFGQDHPSPLKLHPGDSAPSFTLPNPQGQPIALQQLLEDGPVVVTFYRGVWCPYCNLELQLYQAILPQITEAGASLVAISPMTPDSSLSMQEQHSLGFHVLSDVGNAVARRYTTVFRNPDSSIQAMADLGYDFYAFYGDESAEIPVPATFVINQAGIVTFAASKGGDYRDRVEPQEVLQALASAGNAESSQIA